jgi:putative ABC transport system permease protein
VSIGLAIGAAGALAMGQAAASLVFGVSARDPLRLGAAAMALAAAAAIGSLLPARRASRVDPMIALRDE